MCVSISRGYHFPMHCFATSVKEVKILTINVPVGALLILCLNVCTKGRGVTPICTVVTTVIGDQAVAVVKTVPQNCQSKLRKWGMFISPVALQILLGAQCGHISATVNISYTIKLRIKSTTLTVNQVAMCLPCFAFHISILHTNTHSYKERACM